MVARVQYRRKHTYRTRSNHVRKFRTPGIIITIKLLLKEENYPSNIQAKETQSEFAETLKYL
jgi:ribosomal protein L34E